MDASNPWCDTNTNTTATRPFASQLDDAAADMDMETQAIDAAAPEAMLLDAAAHAEDGAACVASHAEQTNASSVTVGAVDATHTPALDNQTTATTTTTSATSATSNNGMDNSLDDDDDFGDFAASPSHISATLPAKTNKTTAPSESTAIEPLSPTPAPAQTSTEASKNEVSATTTTTTAPMAVDDDDDEFGDFGGSSENLQPEVVLMADTTNTATIQNMSSPLQSSMIKDELTEERIQSFTTSSISHLPLKTQQTLCSKLAHSLSTLYPILTSSPQTSTSTSASTNPFSEIDGLLSTDTTTSVNPGTTVSSPTPMSGPQVTLPNPRFEGTRWAELLMRVSCDQSYSETSMSHIFRWKKSGMRKFFLKSLDIDVPDHSQTGQNVQSSDIKSSHTTHSNNANPLIPAKSQDLTADNDSTASTTLLSSSAAPGKQFETKDSRAMDLEEAKRLCNISEDDFAKMSNAELEQIIQSLAIMQVKMQEQSIYWLDSKEQLIMDAEMHNKMIKSLVQYATQQQQQQPKAGGPRSKSPVKAKKKPIGKK